MSKVKINKREELRFAVQQGKAQMESAGGLFAFLKGMPKALPIINISQQGLRLLSKKKLNVGDKLVFNVAIPVLGAKPLNARGEVAWVKIFTIFDEYLVGVKFSGMSKDSRSRLNNLITFLGTRSMPNRSIVFKEFKKRSRSCVVCQYATKGQPKDGSLRYREFRISPTSFA